MGGGPPRKDDGVGQIQTTLHLMFFFGAVPLFTEKKKIQQRQFWLSGLYFLLPWGSRGAPGVADR